MSTSEALQTSFLPFGSSLGSSMPYAVPNVHKSRPLPVIPGPEESGRSNNHKQVFPYPFHGNSASEFSTNSFSDSDSDTELDFLGSRKLRPRGKPSRAVSMQSVPFRTSERHNWNLRNPSNPQFHFKSSDDYKLNFCGCYNNSNGNLKATETESESESESETQTDSDTNNVIPPFIPSPRSVSLGASAFPPIGSRELPPLPSEPRKPRRPRPLPRSPASARLAGLAGLSAAGNPETPVFNCQAKSLGRQLPSPCASPEMPPRGKAGESDSSATAPHPIEILARTAKPLVQLHVDKQEQEVPLSHQASIVYPRRKRTTEKKPAEYRIDPLVVTKRSLSNSSSVSHNSVGNDGKSGGKNGKNGKSGKSGKRRNVSGPNDGKNSENRIGGSLETNIGGSEATEVTEFVELTEKSAVRNGLHDIIPPEVPQHSIIDGSARGWVVEEVSSDEDGENGISGRKSALNGQQYTRVCSFRRKSAEKEKQVFPAVVEEEGESPTETEFLRRKGVPVFMLSGYNEKTVLHVTNL